MKLNKFLLVALVIALVPFFANAEANVDVEGLKAKLTDLRAKHTAYETQVVAEGLTREDAINMWKTDLEAFRAEKDQFFTNKMDGLKEKYGKLAEKFPEKAAMIKARFEDKNQNREARKAELKNLLQQRRSGEINREDFRDALKSRQEGRRSERPDRPTGE